MAYKEILYNTEGNLGIITINRPPMNALTNVTWREIAAALGEALRDQAVRAVVITGSGDRAFSAGQDFSHLERVAAGEEMSGVPRPEAEGDGDNCFRKLYYLEKPTIAALNGVVAVGSNALWLACDIRIASDKARIALNFLARALMPHNGCSWFLPRLVGESRALELFYNYGHILNAEEALKYGLVSQVVPHNELMKVTKEYASRIGNGPPLTMALTKRAIRKSSFLTLQEHMEYEGMFQAMAHSTEDFKEATVAFREKREPVFRGR
ncbi:MAG: enoyl-CoA hydratase/isomerase family protein [Chloroflexi bacterium]|nr:enoyl-CoA hydratase/isomerase family protein [Chloroflexota bacterium]